MPDAADDKEKRPELCSAVKCWEILEYCRESVSLGLARLA